MEIRWSKTNSSNDNIGFLSGGFSICFTYIISFHYLTILIKINELKLITCPRLYLINAGAGVKSQANLTLKPPLLTTVLAKWQIYYPTSWPCAMADVVINHGLSPSGPRKGFIILLNSVSPMTTQIHWRWLDHDVAPSVPLPYWW